MTMSMPTLGVSPIAATSGEGVSDAGSAPIDAVFAGVLATMLMPQPLANVPTSMTTSASLSASAEATDAGAESTAPQDPAIVDAGMGPFGSASVNAVIAGAIALQTLPNPLSNHAVMASTRVTSSVDVPAAAALSGVTRPEELAATTAATDSRLAASNTNAASEHSLAADETTFMADASALEFAPSGETTQAHELNASSRLAGPTESVTEPVGEPVGEPEPKPSNEPAAAAAFTTTNPIAPSGPDTPLPVSKGGRATNTIKAIESVLGASGQSADTTAAATHGPHGQAPTLAPTAASGSFIATNPVSTTAPPAIDQILEAVAPLQHSGDGNYELTLELRPHDLGRVEITVLMREGVLSMHMSAEHAEARQLLRDHVEHLRGLLNNSGVTTGSFDISDQGHHQPQSNAQSLNEQLAHGRDERADRHSQAMNPTHNSAVNHITDEPALATHVSSTREASTRVDVHA